jgi:hypothetical protein
MENVNVLRIGPSSGLIWSKTKAKLEIKEVESIEKQIKIDKYFVIPEIIESI